MQRTSQKTQPAAPTRSANQWNLNHIGPSVPRQSASPNVGNQAMLRHLSRTSVRLQPKLQVGTVDDPLEAEADRVADQVMRMPDAALPDTALSNPSAANGSNSLHRKCAACEEEEEPVHRKENGPKENGPAHAEGEAPPLVHEALRSPGQPLDPASRAFFEPRFGQDLSHVQLHTGDTAARSAAEVSAHAYALGNHIVLGSGAGSGPNRILAHELAHVSQQTGSDVHPLRRAPDVAPPAAATAETDTPAGAPVVLQYVPDASPDEEAETPQAAAPEASAQPAVQRSFDSSLSGTLRRQSAPAAAAAAATAAAPTLKWSDFPVKPQKVDGFSANTKVNYSWRQNKAGKVTLSVTFSKQESWAVVADQTPALLRHEQYHMNLAVMLVNKAHAAQAAGTLQGQALIDAFVAALEKHEKNYDDDTRHARNVPLQSMWEKDIDAGIPEFPVTEPPN